MQSSGCESLPLAEVASPLPLLNRDPMKTKQSSSSSERASEGGRGRERPTFSPFIVPSVRAETGVENWQIGEEEGEAEQKQGEMAESKDPTIKLFGKTIKLTVEGEGGDGDEQKAPSNKEANHESEEKNEKAPVSTEEEKNDEQTIMTNEEQIDPNSSSPEKNSEAIEEPNEANKAPQDKSLKKPDKILPCPRCNSTDTKFCYYNNYNVNQPRYFCKNCQRYWTDGGSMRNVPVGAGRRKSKTSAANQHYRQITIPDCVHSNLPESIHLQHMNSNGTVLSFGSEAPLCESMVSVLNIVGKTIKKCNWVGIHRAENGEEQSSRSSVTASTSNDQGQGSLNSNSNGFPPNVAYGTPWPYPWSHPPPFGAASFPIPFYPPPAYWGMPCLSPQLSTSPSSGSSCSGPNSTTLGKHSREGKVLNHSDSDKGDSPKPEKRLWIPKTLRIDDPEKAAKCSVWATMGLFKNDKVDSISKGGGLFQAFESNGSAKTRSSQFSQVLHTNPAALSRSLSFQESSLVASAHGVSDF